MKLILFFILGLCVLLSSCINTNFDTARMLQKGNTEIGGSISHYSASNDDETEPVGNQLGLRVGYGFSERFNMRLTFDRFFPKDNDNDGGTAYSALTLTPKFRLIKDKLALTVPIGMGFISNDEASESRWVVSPALLYTHTAASNKFDFTGSFRFLKYFNKENEENADLLIGLNAGIGLSSNLDIWAFRPELGLLVNPDEHGSIWTFGLGFQYIIGVTEAKK